MDKDQHCNCQCGCHHHETTPNELTGRTVQWGMLLSHHAPCDYDRTWEIGKLRICTRCAGMFAGWVAGLSTAFFFKEFPVWYAVAVCALLMLPAAADFCCHELVSAYRSHNAIRVITGILFGYPFGVVVWLCFYHGVIMPTVTILLYAALMEIVISFIFFFRGHLEKYLSKYELAVFGELKSFHHHHEEDDDCECQCDCDCHK